VCVRVYADWVNQPREYELVSVPLQQLSVSKHHIAQAFGRDPGRAALIVTADDQEDPTARVILDGFACLYFYDTAARQIPIWPQRHRNWRHIYKTSRRESWVFRDADGNPLPNVTVDICIASRNFYDSTPHIWLKTVATSNDAKLELPMLLAFGQVFHGFVHHPDCGVVRVSKPSSGGGPDKCQIRVPARPKDNWCVFADALGDPIPNATVEVCWGPKWIDTERILRSQEVTLDEQGRLKPPVWDPNLAASHFILQHPDYGRVLIEPSRERRGPPPQRLETCTVPLVKIGTEADRRSIWGTVVDPNQKPLPDVIIGTGPSIQSSMWRTLTDPNGRFCWYLPWKAGYNGKPMLRPLGHKHYVVVAPPADSGLAELKTHLESGRESTITLQPLEEIPAPKPSETQNSYFHRFAFEDQNGLITDTEMLSNISIEVFGPISPANPRGMQVWQFDKWKEGIQSPVGTYMAHDRNQKRTRFDMLRVGPDSSELLVFKATPAFVCEGLVTDGVTGQPLKDAVVVVSGGFRESYDLRLTQYDWQQLYARAMDPFARPQYKLKKDAPAVIGWPTVTDETGYYHINFRPGQVGREPRLLILKQGYMPFYNFGSVDTSNRMTRADCDANWPTASDSQVLHLEVTKLFPGATVLFELDAPDDGAKKLPMRFKWQLEGDDGLSWRQDFEEAQPGLRFLHTPMDIWPGPTYAIPIPAEQTITIQLSENRENLWLPIVMAGIMLERGEVLDLGRITLERPVP
jgi:hypothetical protein